MKKISAIFFFVLLFSPFVFADETGTISRVLPSSSSGAAAQSGRNNSTEKTVVSRTTTTSQTSNSDARTSSSSSTVVRSGSRVLNLSDETETSSPRNTTVVSSNSGTVSRAVQAGDPVNQRQTLSEVVSTVGRNARVESASINNNPTVRRAGITLRPSTAEVGGRATIAGTDIQTGSNISDELRSVSARATTTTRESIAEAQERLEQTAELTKSCQQQYNDCMDQFCAVVDSNQKRCSCSPNLEKYEEVEDAVKDANNQLNEVAQRIRYVGLSADEITAILTETEAEAALSGQTDTSETRNMLEQIEKLIQEPNITAGTYTATADFSGLDMDLDFSSTSDIFSLDILNNSTQSFSNLRGTNLYNAAKSRCSSILTKCKEAGATSQQITGNYDLAIDKDCVAYEQGLEKMNDTLLSNVRSANLMLQKARLAVLQNKNQYDAKGCIGALEACMLDDMVCGSDYTKCLDPTKRYIDENGEVILGQDVTDITDFMTNYNNANIDKVFLENTASQVLSLEACTKAPDKNKTGGNDGSCVVKYLMSKIGTGATVKEGGLCRPVLDKCQNYTYNNEDGSYNPYNDVVVNYIQRAMVNIKAAQQKIISDYASSCMVDIASCYNQQVTQVNAWSSSASIDSVYNVMRGACRNVALTCGYAIFAEDKTSCPDGDTGKDTCINSISEMFYQSLLCPENSSYTSTAGTPGVDGYVNAMCKCNNNYEVVNNQCLKACAEDETRNSYGVCIKNSTT